MSKTYPQHVNMIGIFIRCYDKMIYNHDIKPIRTFLRRRGVIGLSRIASPKKASPSCATTKTS